MDKSQEKKDTVKTSSQGGKKEENKLKSRRKLCCCLSILGLVIFALIFYFGFLRLFLGYADQKVVPTPTFTPTGAVSTPPPTPKVTPTRSASYPEPQACEPLALVDSVPLDISINNPGFKQDIDTHYYDIYGYTQSDLRGQMNICGSKAGGEAYDAYTSYYIDWTYDFDFKDAGCSLKDVAVGVKVDFFYPRWISSDVFEAGLDQKWQEYITNLEIHENIHKDYDIEAAQTIFNALENLTPSGTCEEASSLANETSNNILSDYATRNANYDETTGHGMTQGAYFPR